MPGCCGGCLFLLYCYYCSTVLKSEWQWPEPFQTTERRSIFVMRKWKWWHRRSLTLTVSCAMKEQWSARGNYGVGEQWHHHHETRNQGTSSKCTKMHKSSICYQPWAYSYSQTVKNWAQQFCKERKRQRAKNQVQEYKMILLTMGNI